MSHPDRWVKLGFQWETQDPFLFCAHHQDAYPAGNEDCGPAASLSGRRPGEDFDPYLSWRMYHGRKVPGFPAHPHCGFETITIVTRGYVDHADSTGACGRYDGGDVQWMTAGRGLQHAEMFPLLYQDRENPLELFQIWLNLPARSKRCKPCYKMFWREEIPVYHTADNRVEVRVLAGQFSGVKSLSPPPDSWAADPDNHVGIFHVTLQNGATVELPEKNGEITRSIYVYSGDAVSVNDTQAIAGTGLLTTTAVSHQLANHGTKEAKLLILEGKPIGETVVQYGPFVMNSAEEIREVMAEFRKTAFGGWPWDSPEVVHGKQTKRFARYSDGTMVYPPAEKNDPGGWNRSGAG